MGVGDRGLSKDVLRLARHGHAVVDAGAPLGRWDAAVVLTDHSALDYQAVADAADVVLDTRGVYRRLGLVLDHVESL